MTEPGNQRTIEPGYSYRNLDLWQQAQDFAAEMVKLAGSLPANRAADPIARQLVRSATSISANIAEGHGRFSYAAYKHHLSIAKGSACETDSWLDLLRRLSLLEAEREGVLHSRCSTLIGALTKRIRDLERASAKSMREPSSHYVVGDDEFEGFSNAAGSKVQRFEGSADRGGSES